MEELHRQTGELIQAARSEGVKAGKRLAKGKSEFAKPRGRPKLLNDIWALQFVDFVDARLADGRTRLSAAVEEYRHGMARFLKAEARSVRAKDGIKGLVLDCAVFEQNKHEARGALMNLYRRIKDGSHKIEDRNRKAYFDTKAFRIRRLRNIKEGPL
jgi:hypothetical protein